MYRNGVHDHPETETELKQHPPKKQVEKKTTPPKNTLPDFGPLRPAGPMKTGTVKSSSAPSRDIPASTSKDHYPPNHPAMKKELDNNTTKAATYAAKNSEFRSNWLETKLSKDWKYDNKDFHNFNKGACGAMLHLSVDHLVSDGYREGYGYGDTRISERAERMIRRGYHYASKP